MNAGDMRRLAALVDAVEQAGGEVEAVDVDERRVQGGASSALLDAMAGEPRTEPVFDLRITAGGVRAEQDETDRGPSQGDAAEEQDEVEGGADENLDAFTEVEVSNHDALDEANERAGL